MTGNKKDEKTKATELQERLDAIREEAEAEGLAIVVAWYGEFGCPESVTLQSTDKVSIGIME